MCLLPKPKIPKVEAPAATPPPPTETATSVQAPSSRPSTGLAAKRRGISQLVIDKPGAGVAPPPAMAGLKL